MLPDFNEKAHAVRPLTVRGTSLLAPFLSWLAVMLIIDSKRRSLFCPYVRCHASEIVSNSR